MYLLKAVGLMSTIVLMAWMYYFVVGCGPLLVLKHDTPQDARVIRGFFHVHYRVLTALALLACICFALADRQWLAMAMVGIAAYGAIALWLLVPAMDRLRATMSFTDKPSIRAFRRRHITGFLLNIAALAALTIAISRPSAALFTCVDVPRGCTGSECRHECSL